MAQKDPIDELFEEIGSLLRFVEKNLNNMPSEELLPIDINDRLDALEKRVEALNRISEDIVRAANVPQEELKMRLQGISRNVQDVDREIMAKGDALKTTVDVLDRRTVEINKAKATKVGDPDKKGSGKNTESETPSEGETETIEEMGLPPKKAQQPVEGRKRKNKFKRFGGDDKWKPL